MSDKKSVESKEIAVGIVLDFDRNGNLVGIDIDNTSIVTRYPEDFSKLIEAYPKNTAEEYLSKTKKFVKSFRKNETLKE